MALLGVVIVNSHLPSRLGGWDYSRSLINNIINPFVTMSSNVCVIMRSNSSIFEVATHAPALNAHNLCL